MAETAEERQGRLLKRRERDRAHAAPSVSAEFYLSQGAKRFRGNSISVAVQVLQCYGAMYT